MNQIVIDLKIERFIHALATLNPFLPQAWQAGSISCINIVALKHFSIAVL
jgi:hypothetical protein